jgi:hypothetical protein
MLGGVFFKKNAEFWTKKLVENPLYILKILFGNLYLIKNYFKVNIFEDIFIFKCNFTLGK